jgi:Cu+-exporting ATPase
MLSDGAILDADVQSSECTAKVNAKLESLAQTNNLTYSPLNLADPITTLSYLPTQSFNIRAARSSIADLGFNMVVVHEDSLEDRARNAQRRERRRIFVRWLITLLFSIPVFVIAVVGMAILPSSHPFRRYWMDPVWGSATRGTVALFALATPVQFGVGWFFYERAFKSLRAVWRPRRGRPMKQVWMDRLLRWGSMDTLVALGTSLAYIASLAYMGLDISISPTSDGHDAEAGTDSFFDSSVFLMLFILAGRYLESLSKGHTGDAVTDLVKMKPVTGFLVRPLTAGDEKSTETEEIISDYIEVGDELLIPSGASPPLDAIVLDNSPSTNFNESSLTGEAKPVLKSPGDVVYAGTTNAGPSAIRVRVTSRETVLDGIVAVVRDAMGKKAGLERVAEKVTALFVPAIVFVACLTFVVWTIRGYAGDLPPSYLNGKVAQKGGWALFAASSF